MAVVQVDELVSTVRLEVDQRSLGRVNNAVRQFEGRIGALQKAGRGFSGSVTGMSQGAGQLASSLGTLALRFAGPAALAAGVVKATKASIDFESVMADVRKVVDFPTPEAFQQMGDDITALSNRLPIASEGIAAIVAAAGQAGIAREELLGFAEDAAKVAVAFDISADQAGDAQAKLRTGLGLSQGEVNLLTGTINELSNNMASNAAEVLKVVQNVGALGTTAGLSGEQVAALGSAMIAAGANADVAKTATKGLFLSLTQGDATPKKTQEAFEALGLSVKNVAEGMQRDAESTIIDVFERINELAPEVQSSITTQIFGRESVGAIGPLASNMDLLRKAFDTAGDSISAAGSVQAEFEARANTTANRLQLLRNRAENAATAIGDGIKPALSGLLDLIDSPEGQQLGTQAMENFTTAIRATVDALQVLGRVLADIVGALRPVVDGFRQTAETILPRIRDALGGVVDAFKALGEAVTGTLGNSSSALQEFGRIASSVFGEVLVTSLRIFEDSIRVVTTIVGDLRDAIAAFSEGDLREGFINLGRAIVDGILEPIRLVSRELIALASRIGGERFVPEALKAFAEGGEVFQARRVAAADRARGRQVAERERELREELGFGQAGEGAVFGGQIAVDFAAARREPGKTTGQRRAETRARIGQGRRGVSGGNAQFDAFSEIVKRQIDERVRQAEVAAGAAGATRREIRAAGRAERVKSQELARQRQFFQLGIDPLQLAGRAPQAGVGPAQQGAIAVTIVQLQAGAISDITINGNFSGSPNEIARSLMNQVIDEVSQATQLRRGAQVQ